MLSPHEEEKKRAALHAAQLVRDGQVVGLGTGSTAKYMIRELGRRIVQEGLAIKGVPTSRISTALAERYGIPLTTLEENPELDIDIDGADQVDAHLNVIKGMGGALTREKVVASASRLFIVIVDSTKMAPRLGDEQVLPVEIIPFAVPTVKRRLTKLGGKPTLRLYKDGTAFITDNGNSILDVEFGHITNPRELDANVKMTPGVVENGLFIEMADAVFVGISDGTQEHWREPR